MRTYKLYYAITATTAALASVIIQRSGRIKSVRWETGFDAPADNASCVAEISTASSPQQGTNDTVAEISEIRNTTNLTTSGAFNGGRAKQEFIDYPVAAGERIYLHATVSGTVSQATTVFIDVEEAGGGVR